MQVTNYYITILCNNPDYIIRIILYNNPDYIVLISVLLNGHLHAFLHLGEFRWVGEVKRRCHVRHSVSWCMNLVFIHKCIHTIWKIIWNIGLFLFNDLQTPPPPSSSKIADGKIFLPYVSDNFKTKKKCKQLFIKI